MREVSGDLWKYPADIRIITTNGTVKSNGDAVLGRGCARQAVERYPQLPHVLGKSIRERGNHVRYFPKYDLIAFPVKHAWFQAANIDLIIRSVQELLKLIRLDITYAMVRPGCGNGQLSWMRVRPHIKILPDNVVIVEHSI